MTEGRWIIGLILETKQILIVDYDRGRVDYWFDT